MPLDLEEIYTASSPSSFRGDGQQYTIFYSEEINKSFFRGFQNNDDLWIESYVKYIVDTLEIDTQYQPDLEQLYLWKKFEYEEGGDTLVILYFQGTQTLYFLQNLT